MCGMLRGVFARSFVFLACVGFAVTGMAAPPVSAGPTTAPAVVPSAPVPLSRDDVVVLYNDTDSESNKLAVYYANRRGIARDRLVGLRVRAGETLPRERYADVVLQVRRALRERRLDDRARCLVLMYGLPLRVLAFEPNASQKALVASLEHELADVVQALDEQIATLESLRTGAETQPASRPTGPVREYDLQQLGARYARAKAAVAQQLGDVVRTEQEHERKVRFFAVVETVEGKAGLVAHIRPQAEHAHPTAVKQLEAIRQQLQELETRINHLLASPVDSPSRAEARRLVRELQGLAGAARILREDRDRLDGRESTASLDSELALLWWDGYPLYRWQMNLLAWRARTNPTLRHAIPEADWQRPILMVARLDGPTPAVVRRMIDDSIAAERNGLAGTFYVDARGVRNEPSYGAYDQNLRDLAAMVRDRAHWPVVLDDTEALFSPGTCPNTALYCGWYHLRRYIPAFQFVRGAVGYHMASQEAESLHDIAEPGWCKRMLEEGAAATLGPVSEPYLQAFPLPREFFGLLMTGRFSLAECYAFTNPFNSWAMTLIGDPLYRPFAARPALRVSDVFAVSRIPPEYREPDASSGVDATTSAPASRATTARADGATSAPATGPGAPADEDDAEPDPHDVPDDGSPVGSNR